MNAIKLLKNLSITVKLTILFLMCHSILFAQESKTSFGAPPTLGNYAATNVLIGGNQVVIPTSAPTNTTRTTARASSGFKGILTVTPSNGRVRITNAQPAGTYTITVTADDGSGTTATRTFSLTVQNAVAGCAPYNAASFTRSSASPFGVGAEPTYPRVGDFNNDGRQDVVIANFSGNNVSVLLGSGDGNFGAATNYPTGTSPEYIDVNDFNGDGNADFAVGNVNSSNFNVYLGNGAGGFTQSAGSPFGTGGSFTRFVVAEDFDRNGTIDIATANEMSNNVSIMTGNGNGGFTLAAQVGTGGRPSGLVKGDFNNDSFIDLAVNTFSNTVLILQGNGAGGFTASAPTSLPAFANFLDSGDFNNDNILDLLTDNDSGTTVPAFLNNGAGSFTTFTANIGIRTFGLSVADFDGDGKSDFIITPSFSSTVNFQRSNGDGTFTNMGNITGFDTATGHAVGDFNGDNNLDFVVAEFNRMSSLQGCVFFITNTSLPNGRVGMSYSQNINVQGGTPSYSYSATNLPNGLTINPSTGVISGIPTLAGTFSPTITVTDSTPFASNDSAENLSPSANRVISKNFQIVIQQVVTSANASISGRALTADGRGIRNARVSVTLPNGEIGTVLTDAFGYYLFENLPVGETYILSIAAKRYVFSNQPRVIFLGDDLTGADFVGNSE